MNKSQEDFKLYLELFIKTTKDVKERVEIIKKEPDGSTEQKIQLEVLNKHLMPELNKISSTIYSAILTYNKEPEMLPSLTREDILRAELAMDEFRKILESTGANLIIEYKRDTNFQDIGSGTGPE